MQPYCFRFYFRFDTVFFSEGWYSGRHSCLLGADFFQFVGLVSGAIHRSCALQRWDCQLSGGPSLEHLAFRRSPFGRFEVSPTSLAEATSSRGVVNDGGGQPLGAARTCSIVHCRGTVASSSGNGEGDRKGASGEKGTCSVHRPRTSAPSSGWFETCGEEALEVVDKSAGKASRPRLRMVVREARSFSSG